MRQFRVTKYNPKHRNSSGAYTIDEWTEYSDVGKLVSIKQYEKVESSYLAALNCILIENQIDSLYITDLEDHENLCPFVNGQVIFSNEFAQAFRSVLRSSFWCKFESKDCFVHFGYDYYAYIGVASLTQSTIDNITITGLFVENYDSPYL